MRRYDSRSQPWSSPSSCAASVMRSQCPHQPGTISATFVKRALVSGVGNAKAHTIPRGPTECTPAKRTRAWNATRVFAGDTW